MQLKKRRRPRRIRNSLTALSATLLAATITGPSDKALAQDYGYGTTDNNFGPGVSYSEFDSALLVYQESNSRVMAIEPAANLTVHGAWGAELSLGVIFDAVSGATPNGAAPSDRIQTFVVPIKAQGSTATVTSASGGGTVIHLPPTPGQVAAAALGIQYTTAPNTLPVDKGFHDHREAFNFSWSQPLGAISQVGFGGGYSQEQDYRAITANVRVAQNFNSDNTTVSLAVNGEFNSSFPYGGVPVPLSAMNPTWKTPSTRTKSQTGFVLGLTEVMSRHWLMQLNYSFDTQSGYQNDPYKVISLVDPTSGEPANYLYESRPNNRQSQSIFWDNKFDFGPSVTDLSLRYFTDDWGITSKTAELSERIDLSPSFYIEPSARWYQQSSASFFHNYLVQGQTLPAFASSDSRLAAFTSQTYGVKIGFNPTGRTELYLRAGYYRQFGDSHPAGAIGQLAQQNLFAGTDAVFGFIGYRWDFH